MANAGTAKYVIKLEDRTKKAFKSIGRGLNKTRKAVFSLKTGMVSVAGIAGMGYLIKRSMDTTDELAKMSRAVGVSVENLSRLRHAANIGGMEAKKLDKAVQKLAVNMGDMSRGIGLAKDVFEKYNITVTNSDGSLRGITDVMGDVADVFQGVTNKTEKADMAYKLFGARGAEMINILEGGKVALSDMMMEADKLGLVMSSETAKGVEDANDAITRLSGYLTSTFHQAVAKLAPAIQLITDNIRKWVEMKIDSQEGGIAGIAREMANAVIHSAINMIEALDKVGNAVIGFVQKVQQSIPVALGGFRQASEILEDIRDIENKIGMTKTGMNNSWGIMDSFGEGDKKTLQVLQGELAGLRKELDASQNSLIAYRFNNSALVGSLENLIIYQEDLTTASEENNKEIESASKSYKDLNTTLSDTSTAFADAAVNYALIGKHMEKNTAIFDDTAEQLKKAKLAEIVESMADSMETSITDAIMNIGQGVTSLKDMFKDLARIILKQFVQISVAKPAAGWLASAAGSLFSADGGGYTGAGTRTGGIDNKGGFPAILHPNETVIDHTKGGNAGTNNVNVSFNITANDTNGFDELLESRRGMIVNLINGAMNDRGTLGVV